jgi:hypothetical protein
MKWQDIQGSDQPISPAHTVKPFPDLLKIVVTYITILNQILIVPLWRFWQEAQLFDWFKIF